MPTNPQKPSIPGLRPSVSAVAPNAINPADIGAGVQHLRSINEPWAQELAGSVERLQDAVQKIMQYLRNSAPKITRFEVDDANTGQPVAVLGTFIPRETGVPLVNYFSKLVITDNPDPMLATFQLTISGSGFVMNGMSGGALTADFVALTTGQLAMSYGGQSLLLSAFSDAVVVDGQTGISRTVNNPTQLIFKNGICVGAT